MLLNFILAIIISVVASLISLRRLLFLPPMTLIARTHTRRCLPNSNPSLVISWRGDFSSTYPKVSGETSGKYQSSIVVKLQALKKGSFKSYNSSTRKLKPFFLQTLGWACQFARAEWCFWVLQLSGGQSGWGSQVLWVLCQSLPCPGRLLRRPKNLQRLSTQVGR